MTSLASRSRRAVLVKMLVALMLVAPAHLNAQVFSATLPVSRSAVVGKPVTIFGTIVNGGAQSASGCGIALPENAPLGLTMSFQATDPATNQLVGVPNTPLDIAAGQSRNFVLTLTPSLQIPVQDLSLVFDCVSTQPASVFLGVNTVLVSASCNSVADVVALAATASNDGIVSIAGNSGTGSFAVATVNMGLGDTITVTADTGGATIPVSLSLCETNPSTGACLQPPAPSVLTTISNSATPTFAIFARANGSPVRFDPASNRIFVRFRDGGGVVRGATSVAVKTQ